MKRSLRKLVFVEPKSTHLHIYSRVTIPRLGSVLLGTIMRDKGYDVRVYIEDIHAIDMKEVMSADLVAISAITSTAPQSYRLADRVREAGIIPVLGGTHVSFLPEEAIKHADYVVRGEGEFAFQELVDAIQLGAGFEKIQNLSYLDESGRLINNPERPKIPNLDVNPIADYRLIAGWKPGGVVSVATSRGCPFSCTFCSVPGMYGHAFHALHRPRPARIAEPQGQHVYVFRGRHLHREQEALQGAAARHDRARPHARVGRPGPHRDGGRPRAAGADARLELLQRVRRLRADQPTNAQALPEEAGPGEDRALDRALPRPQDPHPRHVRRRLGRGRHRDAGCHGGLRAQARHRLDPVHDPAADSQLTRLGHALRQGRQVRHQPELDALRRPPLRAPAAAHEPLRAADRGHQGDGEVLLVGRHRPEARQAR